MARVSFQILDGLERGTILADLETPVTIGREEDNDVRLNDERVSRFHAKVQDDGGHVILTDLQSTNGTRVNGHPVQVHVLQLGDQIQIGRCLLIFGSREQVAQRIAELQRRNPRPGEHSDGTITSQLHLNPGEGESLDLAGELFPAGPPQPPAGLSPLQTAQTCDLLAYFHSSLSNVFVAAEACADRELDGGDIRLPREAWLRIQQLQMDLAQSLKSVTEP
jgi:predicted component of type VI protein secretion system